MGNRILIIEDDADIRESIRTLLGIEGFTVDEAPNGMDGLKKLSVNTELVILDIMMPGISGLKICEEIRKVSYVPILFLTAKSKESDKLLGFMAGGDDYLVKPFSYVELSARIKALLRRRQIYDKNNGQAPNNDKYIEIKGLKISQSYNEVMQNGRKIKLTEIEYRILMLMMSFPNKIFTLQNLYESIWEEPFTNASANTIMVHIRNLRTKIEENPQKPKIIRTVWGKGYRLGEPESW